MMTDPPYSGLEIDQAIGILRLKNPPQNYLMKPDFIPVDSFLQWIEKNELKGLVISGTGRHFSGGARLEDIFAMADKNGVLESELEKGMVLLQTIRDLTIPVVAAIRGVCFGGGLEIALSCHMRFCSDNALFAFPETNQGLIPGLGGNYLLRDRLPLADSLKIILGGDMLTAGEAMTLKIVDRVLKEHDPAEYAVNFLKKITEDRPKEIVQAVMLTLRNAHRMSTEDALKEETKLFTRLARLESRRRKETGD